MGKRSTGRKLAMQALYQAEIRQLPIDDVIHLFLEESPYLEDTREWAIELARQTWQTRAESDEIIQKYSIGWDLERLNIIDKSLLRLAIYEIRYMDPPLSVVLNEIIEISKRSSTDDSPKFINGILCNYAKDECSQASPKN